MEREKVTSDLILDYLKSLVESKKVVPREEWLNCAFKLNLLRLDESKLLNQMRQTVAIKKHEIMKTQEKRNVAAADVEIEASEEYRFMRDQEAKLDVVEEFVRIAKKNADLFQ